MFEKEIEELRNINRTTRSYQAVEQEIERRGRELLPDSYDDSYLSAEDAITRFYRIGEKLKKKDYPVVANVYIGPLISMYISLQEPQNDYLYAGLISCHFRNPDPKYNFFDDFPAPLNLKYLHQVHRGAESLLKEVFGY